MQSPKNPTEEPNNPPTSGNNAKKLPKAEILTKSGTKEDLDKFIDELYKDLAE